ncbi:capsular biosynthesis protein [Brevundimonas sp. Leaf168]|uniref:capsular biosynthesis protein n=1 Tax=Brevundimonas sp. Leaf168 TaxID=1736283 RepID=UPI000AB3044F|nr:capsular biosynthesis protein [Brevundimonas sp. Leaf168]
MLPDPTVIAAFPAKRQGGRFGLSGRRFLVVSAPFGSFGAALASALEARGALVNRMIFNAGDAMNWRRPGGLVFKGTAKSWTDDLARIADDFSDIIVFGEVGAYNRAVLDAAENLRARVWVLENGYFRPDWVTVERDGVNGSSALPRFRGGYPEPAPKLPQPIAVGKILPYHVANISAYHTVQVAGKMFFPNYTAPYVFSPIKQCLGHIRRYVSLAFRKVNACDAEMIRARGEFFIACLQREGDAQLLRYSRYADNRAFLVATMASFAAHAPADARLVVKNHPLDPGLVNLRAVTLRLAHEHGLQGRVDFIDGGNLASLCRASRGMVVNNSSAALSAMGFHTPVKVMGNAFFDFDGLTDQQPLDCFWSAPQAPDTALFTRFRAHVIAQSQVNGNFHEPRAIARTAVGIADVFERA